MIDRALAQQIKRQAIRAGSCVFKQPEPALVFDHPS